MPGVTDLPVSAQKMEDHRYRKLKNFQKLPRV